MKKTIIDPIKEQFVDSAQKFSEADSKYKWVERVVAKANAAIWGLTSPMAPIVKPLQEWVEKWMAAIDNTWKAIAQKIGDTLSSEQKEALRTKLAPRFEGEWADKVAWVLQKIMESPYTEAGINAVSAIIWAKATKGMPAEKYVAIYNPEGKIMNPRVVAPSKIFKSTKIPSKPRWQRIIVEPQTTYNLKLWKDIQRYPKLHEFYEQYIPGTNKKISIDVAGFSNKLFWKDLDRYVPSMNRSSIDAPISEYVRWLPEELPTSAQRYIENINDLHRLRKKIQ